MTIDDIIAALDGASDAEFEPVVRAQFNRVRVELPRSLGGVLTRLHDGGLDDSDALGDGKQTLADAHSNAVYLGRRLAGSDSPYGDFDIEFGKLVAEEQSQFLEKFIADVQGGSYTDDDGNIDAEAIEMRAGFYENRLRGTANEAWCGSLDSEELIDWILDDGADSCTVCPDLAENGPYAPNDMPTWPGANETPCLFNCACEARTQSGKSGF
jgi:hypothetical protein